MDYFFIGEQELVTAFRFVGVEGVAVGDQGSSRSAFLRITQGWDETAGTYLPASDPVQVLIIGNPATATNYTNPENLQVTIGLAGGIGLLIRAATRKRAA
jgi:hypothetical protein